MVRLLKIYIIYNNTDTVVDEEVGGMKIIYRTNSSTFSKDNLYDIHNPLIQIILLFD